MQIKCNRREFVKGLELAGRFVAKRSILPVTLNVKIVANGGVQLTTSNLENWCTVNLPIDAVEGGAALVDCSMLQQVLDCFAGDELEIAADDNKLVVKCDRQEASFMVMNAEEYPPTPTVEAVTFQMPGEDLRSALKRVAIAASSEDTRPVLAGVLFDFGEEGLNVVGADGFRLALAKLDVKGREGRFIVPKAATALIERVVAAGQVDVGFNSSHILVSQGGARVYAGLIAGQFPNWQSLIPTQIKTKATFARKDLQAATKAMLAVRGAQPRVIFEFTDHLKVSSSDPEIAKIKVEMDCQVEGEGITIGFDGTYIRDCLQAMGGEKVTCEMVSSTAPGLFTAEDGYRHLIMPMFISQG